MLIILDHVRDYGTELGKDFVFRVNRNKTICFSTDSDNAIRSVRFHDNKADKVVACYRTVGLVYIENITEGVNLDLNKINEYDNMFEEM